MPVADGGMFTTTGRFIGFIGFMAVAIAVFAALGLWQIQRLEWKRGVLAERATVLTASLIAAEGLSTMPAAEADFRLTLATGLYVAAPPFLLQGQVLDGQLGVRVLSPLALESGGHILIDRGWLAQGTQAVLMIAVTAPPTRSVVVEGRYRRPRSATGLARFFQPDNRPEAGVWHHVDVAAMAAVSGLDLLPGFMVAGDGVPGALAERVSPDPSLPNNHLGYALTWFGLALSTLVMTIITIRRRRGGGTAEKRDN